MPSRTRPAPYEQLCSALCAQAERVADALASADAAAPSRWAGWSVGELDRRLGAVVDELAGQVAGSRGLPAATPADGGWPAALPPVLDGPALPDGPGLGQALPGLRDVLAGASPSTVVALSTGRHLLPDALLSRLVLVVVHGRDLPDPVVPDRTALRLVVRALAQLLGERAPGRHVEARVPPFAAVQCVAGPRHTRGTPPNVVEAEAVAFVELCAGRLAWQDAAADGRVRTWGDRADLSPWLPLLS